MDCVTLEPAARNVARENAVCPLIFQLPVEEGRCRLEQAQNSPVFKYPANIKRMQVDTGTFGTIPVYCILPPNVTKTSSVIFYLHGAGWVFGSLHTHEKLVRELSNRTNSIVIFPEYTRSPEAKYPTALEQCYSVLCILPEILEACHCRADLSTLSVAGDSVGGNMATVMTLFSKFRNGPYIQKQLLYYPVTNACFETQSYCQFACNYYLYREGMMWFWDQYTSCLSERREISASPLCATLDDLHGLPDTMIINGEADVLHSEGQAYADKLRCAGVDVAALCFDGMIHDFVMLNALDQTNACRLAMDASTMWLNRKTNKFMI